MSLSVADMLNQDLQCEGLLSCLHGLRPLDEACFRALARSDEPLTVDEVADDIQRVLDDWYAKMGQLVREFRARYGADVDAAPPAGQ